jgi:DNA-binding NarL/FixJ family response regulator
MDQIAVAVLTDDAITREGAAACLSRHPRIRVLAGSSHSAAAILLVITTGVTNSVLRRIELARQVGRDGGPRVVLVADDLGEQYILRAARAGLVALLNRQETGYSQIARAIEGAAGGRSELPQSILRHLIDQVHAARDAAAEKSLSSAGLAVRELEVLRLLSEGLATSEIAAKLNYSERMVKSIVHSIVVRLNLRNRTHAVAYAMRTGAL